MEYFSQIFVDVTGAVNAPGVYTLTASSRVIDAIKAAGGCGYSQVFATAAWVAWA